MQAATFMDRIYQGTLDKEIFNSFRAPRNLEKIQGVVHAYLEMLKEFDPRSIEEAGRIPAKMLEMMKESGFFGLSIPEMYGGLGFNGWEYLKTIEELVRRDISVVLASIAHLSIGVKGILLFGNESQKQKYLVPAASGDMIFSYALTEPRVGSDAQHIETRAELSEDGSHYILNGQKTYITNANYAGGLTVFAQMDPRKPGFMGAFIVETAWEGVKIGRDMPKMGLKASSTAAIQFKNVHVPVENLLGKPGDGFKIAMTILNYGRLGLGAASLGMIRQSLEDMTKRASSRIQFGVPIRSFPLVQEKLVKAKVYSLVISSMNDFITGILEKDPLANVAVETSHCKLFGTTRAWDVLYDALQVAGGSGYITSNPYEKRMRDFRVATVFEGTTEIHSIYPPLFMIRKLEGRMGTLKGNKVRKLLFLMDRLLRKMEWPLEFEEGVMRKAAGFARKNAASLRRMLFAAMLIHGKKIPQKEFLLRRITALSLYLFGILAVLSKFSTAQKAGALKKEDLHLLDYFLEEAREVRRENRRIFSSPKEKAHERVFLDIFNT
ncbi:acyl-CoA dehydrogenase family protein [Desulforhabdus amnigena]|uniref:Acyl-CoA dehydrogenase n=1 Tax=Desulforhabdus amnigena TaxID=40218 RepID=A0A9W6FWZ5_9BACT|nr:acyl-CoA dehydrogenase family protein [Desulforhabdus amnigena]NLJ27127.1 hypothetical protein [Deltaproteobacteria bacterium]GLI36400.1 hypothetical protein DAMNIGENAA_38330 [Desulforhabdus amnigena]